MSCFSVEILDTNTKVLEIETCVGNEPGNIEIINYDTNNIIIEQCPIVLPSEFSSMTDAEIASFIKSGSGINLNASVTGLTISVSGLNTTYLSNFNTAVSELIPVKNIIASSGISVVNNSGSYTVAVTGQFGLTGEQVDDRVAGLLVAGNGIALNYNDIGDNLTISSTLTSILEAQSLVTTVFNRSQTPIPKMTVVYINGGQGNMPTVAYSIASGESSSSKTYGVTQEIIPAMGSGHVVVDGYIGGLNTDQFNPTAPQGDVNGVTLWLSPTVSGAMTTSKPYAPYHMVAVGKIIRTHQNQGIISVKIQNGYELEELHNVATTGATNGQFLQYNSSNSLWVPSSSGNFSSLKVNGDTVSVVGHSHGNITYLGTIGSISGVLLSTTSDGYITTILNNIILGNTNLSIGGTYSSIDGLTIDGGVI